MLGNHFGFLTPDNRRRPLALRSLTASDQMPTKMIFQASKVGCPIRRSMDQSSFAAPHGFSQRITSFIACACQGIHQMPFFHLIVLIANAHRLCWIWQTYPPRLRSKGCQIWPSGQLSYAAAAKIRRPCSRQTSYARLPFTIALSNNAIDVFDMVLTKVTPSDFEAIS